MIKSVVNGLIKAAASAIADSLSKHVRLPFVLDQDDNGGDVYLSRVVYDGDLTVTSSSNLIRWPFALLQARDLDLHRPQDFELAALSCKATQPSEYAKGFIIASLTSNDSSFVSDKVMSRVHAWLASEAFEGGVEVYRIALNQGCNPASLRLRLLDEIVDYVFLRALLLSSNLLPITGNDVETGEKAHYGFVAPSYFTNSNNGTEIVPRLAHLKHLDTLVLRSISVWYLCATYCHRHDVMQRDELVPNSIRREGLFSEHLSCTAFGDILSRIVCDVIDARNYNRSYDKSRIMNSVRHWFSANAGAVWTEVLG